MLLGNILSLEPVFLVYKKFRNLVLIPTIISLDFGIG